MRVKNHLTQIYGEAPRLWIEICRAGDYSKAGKGVITPDDLRRVVRNYDPSYHEAPVTIGPPADDKPAYAWIDGLMVDGSNLLAREKQVDPKFNEARQAGKFKKRSAAFYCDDRGNVTGLRHVAWLGAQPPEIKGLSDVAFDDRGSKFIAVDFGEDETVAGEKSVTEQVREAVRGLFAEMFGTRAQESIVGMAEDSAGDGLDGKWAEILHAGTIDGETYTPDDLDSLVSEYQKRQPGAETPVGLGTPLERKPEKVGKIDALRRVGKTVEGKFSGIDPDVEDMYARGVFPMKSIQVSRSPDGISLKRVGLIHPSGSPGNTTPSSNNTPSLDELRKLHMGTKEHRFASGRGFIQLDQLIAAPSPSADALITAFKENGYWPTRFDRLGTAALFRGLDHTPLLGKVAGALKMMMDEGDPTSLLLTERARYYAGSHGLTFSEALPQVVSLAESGTGGVSVSQPRRELERANSDRAIASGALSPKLAAIAWQIANSNNVSFKQALSRAAAENPEIVAAWCTERLEQQDDPLGSGR